MKPPSGSRGVELWGQGSGLCPPYGRGMLPVMSRLCLLSCDDYLPRLIRELSREQEWDLSVHPGLPATKGPVEEYDLVIVDARPIPDGTLTFSSLSRIMIEKSVPVRASRALALAYYEDLVGRMTTFVNGGSAYVRIHPYGNPPDPNLPMILTDAIHNALDIPPYRGVDFHAQFPNRDFYREATESLQVPVIIMTNEGIIKLMNLRALACFDYTTQFVVDQDWSMLIAPADRTKRARDVLVRISGGHFYESTLRLVDRHGKEFPALITSARVFSVAQPDELLIILAIHDLTELEELQRQLTMFQKIESAERVVSGMTHEFNNALTAIMGHAELLAEDLPEGTELRQSAEVICRECQRAQELTGRLLGLSSSRQFVPGPVSCREVVLNTQALLRHALGEGIRFETDLLDAGDVVISEASQLQQILVNLCLNARDAMSGEGVIMIRTSVREVAPEDCRLNQDWSPGIFVELAVSDTGCGMSPEVLDRVFEPFFTTKPVGTGSGLGLSVVRGIARSHNGHVGVRSSLGQGTTVMVRLPQSVAPRVPAVELETEPDSVSAELAKPANGGQGILVVDDDRAVLTYAQKVLERAGYDVRVATTGNLALDLLDGHRDELSLVVLDLTMPGTTGRETLDKIRERDADIPIVICTAFAPGGLDDALVDQVQGFIKKPYRPRELVEQIGEVLESSAGG